MTKITTDFVGTETAAVTKQRISDILDYWGYEPDIYTTWGNARTDLNDLLAGTALGTIGASELAGTFLPKLNLLNSPDELMQALLFSNDEPGVFYDFDDWSTLFQDEAGTQPVTAANQGVALALDKSGNDNHATQATTAARPLTVIHPDGGVRNLVDRSEEFDNAVWVKTNATVTANATTAPDGTTTADKLVENSTTNDHYVSQVLSISSNPKSFSVFAKASERTWISLQPANVSGARVSAYFNLSSGVVGGVSAGISAAITDEGDGWFRCTVSGDMFTSAATYRINVAQDDGVASYTGDGTSGIFIWGAQLEEGSEATPYQKRVNFLDVTEAGKRSIRRLYFNGTSHFLQTPTITPNTDKAQVFAGVRKLSDAAIGFILELSDNINNNLGSIAIWNGGLTAGAPQYSIASRGSSPVRGATSLSSFASPTSNVLTGLGDISGDLAALRIDGAQVAQNTADQGTGNYLAYPAYIGARGGTSLFYNGYLDQLITRFGTNLTTGAIETTEKYVSTKSPELVAASEVTWNASTDTYTQNLVGLGR
jgi:hypothetical protein